MTNEEIAIGIDLGTTNSCVAIYRNNRVDVLENEIGDRTTPSCVVFTEDVILTGPEAVKQAHKYLTSTIFEAKRLIGQKFNDPKVQEDINRFPYQVINDLGSPKIKVEVEDGETREYYPEDISAYVLQRMKKIAEQRTQATITRAVVTVPAYFNDAQRQSTKDAATIAGFKSVNIINEPTAAALAFDHENKKPYKRYVLVYDFGGGTFDVSVVEVRNLICKVIATRGDSHLGGTDIDSIIVEELKNDYIQKFNSGLDWSNAGIARRLKNTAERSKIDLSGNNRFHCDIEMAEFGGVYYSSSLSRSRLELLCRSLFSKTIDCVEQCLQDCNINKTEIDEVVLVGGSSRIPKIQNLLKAYFGEGKINQGVNPDEAVAIGAALYAANLTIADKTQLTSIIDVTSLSLGTNVENDRMSIIIPRNSPLPAKAEAIYQTVYNDQTTMDFPIYQGECLIASENVLLGEFKMRGLTEAPAKQVKVKINLEIDTNGILSVSAIERNTTNWQNIVIDVKKCGLKEEQIQERIRDAEINNERFKKRLEFDAEKYTLQEVLNEVNEYADKLEGEKRESILNTHDEICKWLEKALIDDVEKMREHKDELVAVLKSNTNP